MNKFSDAQLQWKLHINRGHSNHILRQTGLVPSKCYRCRLIHELDRRGLKALNITNEDWKAANSGVEK